MKINAVTLFILVATLIVAGSCKDRDAEKKIAELESRLADLEKETGAVALPVLEQPGGTQVVPVFTSELEMAGLLPFVSRYRLVPLGALAAQWPADDLSLTIDGSSEHRLTLTSEGVRTLLARP